MTFGLFLTTILCSVVISALVVLSYWSCRMTAIKDEYIVPFLASIFVSIALAVLVLCKTEGVVWKLLI